MHVKFLQINTAAKDRSLERASKLCKVVRFTKTDNKKIVVKLQKKKPIDKCLIVFAKFANFPECSSHRHTHIFQLCCFPF